MEDLIYHHKDVLGLDIGTNSVKFAQLKNRGKLTKIIGYGKVPVPKDIIIEGVISEPEKLAEYLKKVFLDPPWGKITAKRVIAALPEARIFTRVLELPVFKPKDIDEAIIFEVEQSIPAPISDLYIDWQLIEENKKNSIIFMSAAPKAIVDSYMQFFKSLDLEPLAIEISMAAIARSMVSNKNSGEPVIIVDFGAQSTNIAVFDSTLRVTESHPMGGDILKKQILDDLKIEQKEAEGLIHQGLTENNKARSKIEEEVKKIVTEVARVRDYYEEKYENKKITKVLLCGGLGFLPGLAEYIKAKTDIETKLGNPWVNISVYPLKPVPKEESPVYATVVGLCLRGLVND